MVLSSETSQAVPSRTTSCNPLQQSHALVTVSSSVFLLPFVAYENLQSRKEVREAAWLRPGWDECVGHTGMYKGGPASQSLNPLKVILVIAKEVFIMIMMMITVN